MDYLYLFRHCEGLSRSNDEIYQSVSVTPCLRLRFAMTNISQARNDEVYPNQRTVYLFKERAA